MKLRSGFVLYLTAALLAFPATALAAEMINVQNVEYLAGQEHSGEGSNGGTWSWDGANDMVLDNYDGGGIDIYGDMTVTLEGENRVSESDYPEDDYDGRNSAAFTTDFDSTETSDVIITGSEGATLLIENGSDDNNTFYGALNARRGSLTIDGVDVTVVSHNTDYPAVESWYCDFTVTGGGSLTVEKGALGEEDAAMGVSSLTVEDDSTVTATNNWDYAAIEAINGITVKDSELIAQIAGTFTGESSAACTGDFSVQGSSLILTPEGGYLDEESDYIVSGDGDYVSYLHITRTYTLSYDPAGGTWADGSTGTRTESIVKNDTATVAEAPTREGYTFLYWKGSEYQPGDSITMDADHALVAVWEKNPEPEPKPKPTPTPAPEPASILPKTGDAALLAEACASALCGFAVLTGGLLVRRRKG